MKRILPLAVLLMLCSSEAGATEKRVRTQRQQRLSRWNIPPADYSGIAMLDSGGYALISDKHNGYFPLRITFTSDGKRVADVERGELIAWNGMSVSDTAAVALRDCEGIAWQPFSRTLYISGENDQRVVEYNRKGQATGRELHVPSSMNRDAIYGNYGFEALTYDSCAHRFWLTTESCLRADGKPASPDNRMRNLLRLQSFDDDGRPDRQYAYEMELPTARRRGRHYAYGVSALAALPDGRLLVMEREVHISARYVGSWVRINLFVTDPRRSALLSVSDMSAEEARRHVLPKRKIASFRTRLTPVSYRWANYEGMCLGPRLPDGRQTLLLVSDSQSGAGKGRIRLRDYLKILILPAGEVL
ncbi:MAG: esterase-like activity of phytase family protein [Clostridium sp.]|nr:esterase-like activity of phytase family protein [Clostridium sp.]